MEHNKLVYIASPYSGDVERNVAFAKAACRYAMNQGVTPIASRLPFPRYHTGNTGRLPSSASR